MRGGSESCSPPDKRRFLLFGPGLSPVVFEGNADAEAGIEDLLLIFSVKPE